MDLWNVLAGGAALGVIAGFWDKIKAVVWRLVSLLRPAGRDPQRGRPQGR